MNLADYCYMTPWSGVAAGMKFVLDFWSSCSIVLKYIVWFKYLNGTIFLCPFRLASRLGALGIKSLHRFLWFSKISLSIASELKL